MNRRDFLKLGGISTILFFPGTAHLSKLLAAPQEVDIDGFSYRGSADGKIYVSADQGKTWQLHTNFGSDYAVLNIFAGHRHQIYVEIGYQRYSFFLSSSNHVREWRSVV